MRHLYYALFVWRTFISQTSISLLFLTGKLPQLGITVDMVVSVASVSVWNSRGCASFVMPVAPQKLPPT
jgi:hypothetical protein